MKIVPEDVDESRPYVAKAIWTEWGDDVEVNDSQFGYLDTWSGWKIWRGDTVRLRQSHQTQI